MSTLRKLTSHLVMSDLRVNTSFQRYDRQSLANLGLTKLLLTMSNQLLSLSTETYTYLIP